MPKLQHICQVTVPWTIDRVTERYKWLLSGKNDDLAEEFEWRGEN